MDYDRNKTAGQFDNRLTRAKAEAKALWGHAWDRLTPEMRNAYVCRQLVGQIGGIDFEAAFDGKEDLDSRKLLQKLIDLADVCTAALQDE